MKKLLLILAAFLPLVSNAQIEVHDNGKVSMGGNPPARPACQVYVHGSSAANTDDFLVNHMSTTQWSNGIRTVLPNDGCTSYGLQVGNLAACFYVSGQGWIWSQNGILSGSDSCLKKNLKLLPSSLDKLDLISGYSYHFKPYKITNGRDSGKILQSDTALHWGVLAQEVEKVAPFMVKTMENGTKAVDYMQLIPLNIEAIKELNAKVKTQENEIALMNARFNKLAESIDTAGGVYKLKGSQPSSKYILYQNNPNPSNADTKIKYDMKASYTSAFIYIFNLEGLLKKTYKLSGSTGNVTINSGDLDAGMYLYSLVVDGKEIDLKRMLLTK